LRPLRGTGAAAAPAYESQLRQGSMPVLSGSAGRDQGRDQARIRAEAAEGRKSESWNGESISRIPDPGSGMQVPDPGKRDPDSEF